LNQDQAERANSTSLTEKAEKATAVLNALDDKLGAIVSKLFRPAPAVVSDRGASNRSDQPENFTIEHAFDTILRKANELDRLATVIMHGL